MDDIIKEHQEAFERIAQSDLPASWIAQSLLEEIEGDTSYQVEKSSETDITPKEEPEKEPEGSLFAY